VWIAHIFIGLFYVGWQLLNKKELGQLSIVWLIILGSLATIYHTHLMFYNLMSQ